MSMRKKIPQNDLRKVMQEHKKKLIGVKKIESPLAKYPFLYYHSKNYLKISEVMLLFFCHFNR